MDLIFQQDNLQKQANKILSELNLVEILSEIGEVKIVGSLALGLMVWPDIDIDVCLEEIKNEGYFKVVQYLFIQPNIKKLVISDDRNLSEDLKIRGIPQSIYLGVIYKIDEQEWKIDIRFVLSLLDRAEEYIKVTLPKLTAVNKEIILDIKNQLFLHPEYLNKKLSSVDIYNAVLDQGIKNITEFKEYLYKKSGINL